MSLVKHFWFFYRLLAEFAKADYDLFCITNPGVETLVIQYPTPDNLLWKTSG